MHGGMWTVLASVCNQKLSWETFFGSTPRLRAPTRCLCLWSDLIHFTQSQSINHMEIYVRILSIGRQWGRAAYRKGKIVRQDLDLDRRYANYKSPCLCVRVCAAPALCSYKSLLFLLLFKFKNLSAWSVSSDRWWLHQQLQHLLEIHYNCEPTLSLSLWAVTDCFVISAYSEKWDTQSALKPQRISLLI